MEQILNRLDYPIIKEQLTEWVASGLGKKMIAAMEPLNHPEQIRVRLTETSEARSLLDSGAQIPLRGLHDITDILTRAVKGSVLEGAELILVEDFLRGCRELKRYLKQKKSTAPLLSRYSDGMMDLRELEAMLREALDGARIASSASTRLHRIREQIRRCDLEIQEKLNQLLGSASVRSCLQEAYISVKNERYVLPVKTACRARIPGFQIDSSGSGSTVFIEPVSVRKLSDKKQNLRREEQDEEYQIRAWLSAEIVEKEVEVRQNLDWMALFDFIAARAKHSQQMGGREVNINTRGAIHLVRGKHPLLGAEAVPLSLSLVPPVRTLLITGPNTGGKTVVLKTVGLLTAMVQSGLHIPAEEGTDLSVFAHIMADIGDEQSIQQSLSTFSAHISNISGILDQADHSSLVLLDEIGTGTDPAEGASLAAAILEELYQKGAVTLASTHYGDIKSLALHHPGFTNGAMTFNPDTLQPLYELQMGESGRSHAFWIAQRLGIQEPVIRRAQSWLNQPQDTLRSLSETEVSMPKETVGAAEIAEVFEADLQEEISVGDMIIITATQEKGRVLELDSEKGMLLIQVKGNQQNVQRKRVKLFLKGQVLYPKGYDLNVVLLDKEDRKLDKIMNKRITDQVRIIQNDHHPED